MFQFENILSSFFKNPQKISPSAGSGIMKENQLELKMNKLFE